MRFAAARRLSRLLSLTWAPPGWRISLFALGGLALGLAALTFRISNAASYLSDDPVACINCHIMVPQYATWARSSHRAVATCNDCHVPHSNPVAKLAFKAMDGSRHAALFTLRMEPQVIRISAGAVRVVQVNCVRCHADTMEMVRLADRRERTCWSCHEGVPHGTVRSLSATPNVRRPEIAPAGFPRKPQGE